MKQFRNSYVGHRHHFSAVNVGSGLVTLLFFGLKVKIVKEFEMMCKIFLKIWSCTKSAFPPHFFVGRGLHLFLSSEERIVGEVQRGMFVY